MSLRKRLGLPRLGLRPKIFLFTNVAISATMGLVTVLGVSNERRHQYEALEQRARSVAAALAVPVTDALMNKDLGLTTYTGLTDTYISEILASNRDAMLYVIVTDADGRRDPLQPLVDGRSPLRAGPRPRPRSCTRPAAEIRTEDEGERVLEVREPLHISTRFWGSLAVGFSLEPVEQRIEVIVSRLVVIALLVIVANSVISAISMEWLIRPILNLHQVMQRAGRGDLSVRAGVAAPRRDRRARQGLQRHDGRARGEPGAGEGPPVPARPHREDGRGGHPRRRRRPRGQQPGGRRPDLHREHAGGPGEPRDARAVPRAHPRRGQAHRADRREPAGLLPAAVDAAGTEPR